MGFLCSQRCSRLVSDDMAAGTEGSSLQARSNLTRPTRSRRPGSERTYISYISSTTPCAYIRHNNRKGSAYCRLVRQSTLLAEEPKRKRGKHNILARGVRDNCLLWKRKNASCDAAADVFRLQALPHTVCHPYRGGRIKKRMAGGVIVVYNPVVFNRSTLRTRYSF